MVGLIIVSFGEVPAEDMEDEHESYKDRCQGKENSLIFCLPIAHPGFSLKTRWVQRASRPEEWRL